MMITKKMLLDASLKSKEKGKPTLQLLFLWHHMVERFSKKANFAGFKHKKEMKSEAIVCLKQHGLKFNPEKLTNPIAWYMQIINQGFLIGTQKAKKLKKIKEPKNES